jgi:hypothetical protein
MMSIGPSRAGVQPGEARYATGSNPFAATNQRTVR